MKHDGLQLTVRSCSAGWADVAATVRSHGFSGVSTAPFDESELRQFASSLKAFPLGEEARRGLSGGLCGHPAGPECCLIALSVFQLDAVGHVAVRVRLGASMETWERPLRHLVELEFRTTYGALDDFAAQLGGLLEGTHAEASLRAEHAT